MTDAFLFKPNNIDLFCPWTNEYLFDYIYALGYTDKDLSNSKIKTEVLFVLKMLLSYQVINIYDWGEDSPLSTTNITPDETISEIDRIWFDAATYEDFFKMVMFGTPDWYTHKLKEMGMTETTNWQTFVNNNIDDLKKWLEENQP